MLVEETCPIGRLFIEMVDITTGITKLGEVEYKRLLQEVDLMTKEKVDIDKIINKRLKEIEERLQAEEKEKENQDRRQTRSQAGASSEEPKEEAQK